MPRWDRSIRKPARTVIMPALTCHTTLGGSAQPFAAAIHTDIDRSQIAGDKR
jgi:hypothetical protein